MMKRILPSLIVALAALLVGLAGNGSKLPLDDHEVLVARTSEEMLQRGSMIVPYFNGEPRTAKPPMAYWATMLVDGLGDGDQIISEGEARVPTIAGGVLWALAALALGSILCGPAIGFIAALLLVGTTGFHSYTHSARPELLYAMFCTAGLACFARQWRCIGGPGVSSGHESIDRAASLAGGETRPGETPGPPSFIWPALGWIMMGLAVLTKGPQLPLIMLAAWAIGMAAMGERRAILRTLRPISGVLIVAAIALWWFILMWTGVEGASDRMGRETIGRILQIEGKPLTRIIDPYYFYRIAVLIVPWMALYVVALASPWIKEIKLPRGARMLWWISLITIASLHLTLNRRWYYLLPMLAPLSALMAWTALAIGRAMIDAGRAWIWRALVVLHIVFCLVAMAYLWRIKPEMFKPTTFSLALMGAIGLAAALAILWRSTSRESAERSLVIAALVAVAFMTLIGHRATLWKIERYHRRDFSREIARTLPANATLIGHLNDWEQEQYYLHRVIPSFERRSDLIAALREATSSGDAFLLTNSRNPLDAINGMQLSEQVRISVEPGEDLTLWRVQAR